MQRNKEVKEIEKDSGEKQESGKGTSPACVKGKIVNVQNAAGPVSISFYKIKKKREVKYSTAAKSNK